MEPKSVSTQVSAETTTQLDTAVLEFDKVHADYISNGKHKLNSKWVLWRHSLTSKDWTLKGYDKIAEFNTVEDFWMVYNDLPSVIFDMWFLMRQDITPRWEDDINKEGGAFKFRIHESKVDNIWLQLSSYLVSEMMCNTPADAELISGISISPKRNKFATISVWNLDKTRIGHAVFPNNIEGVDFSRSMYEAHSDRKCG